MPIVPDTKDWTWVLERTCPECGFDVRAFPRESIGAMIRENADLWGELLTHPRVTSRPYEDVWSALEYGCHVRDVFRLYDSRLEMMLEEDDPLYPNWDQNVAAVQQGYEEQEPRVVLAELRAAAAALSQRFDALVGKEWERRGTRSDGARFTVESFGRYLIHDPVHHVNDVEQGFRRLEEV
jgi:phage baseplate assembly protein W